MHQFSEVETYATSTENDAEIRQKGLRDASLPHNDVSTFESLDFGFESASCSFIPSYTDLSYGGTLENSSPDDKTGEQTSPFRIDTPTDHDASGSNSCCVRASSSPQSTVHVVPDIAILPNGNHDTNIDEAENWLRGIDIPVESSISNQNTFPGILTPAPTNSYADTVNSPPSANDPPCAFSDSRQSDKKSGDSWIRKLAEINVSLFEYASTVTAAVDAVCGNSRQGMWSNTDGGRHNAQHGGSKGGFAIDVTFELSRQLLVILSEICSANRKTPPISELGRYNYSKTSNTTNGSGRDSHAISTPQSTVSPQNQWTLLLSDAGSTLLILSCYTRILDIYHKFFDFVLASLSRSNGDDISRQIQLPSFIIGGLSLHSSPVLQITLMVRLVEEVFERLRQVFSQMALFSTAGNEERADGLNGSLDSVGVSEATLQATRSKEACVVKKMNDLRRQLQRSAII